MSPIFICCSSPANTPICVPGNVLRKLFSLLLIFLTSSFSPFYFFFSIKHWFEFSSSTFSPLSLSHSVIISRLHQAFIARLCTFFLFISFFISYSVHFQALFFFFFFVSGRYCGWRSTVWRHCSLSVCMFVCLGKDMLLTLWLSSIWQNANFLM